MSSGFADAGEAREIQRVASVVINIRFRINIFQIFVRSENCSRRSLVQRSPAECCVFWMWS